MEIKKGDTVRLKSGGPIMTVEAIGDYSPGGGPKNGAYCIWFDSKNSPQKKAFDIATLEHED